MVLKNYWERNNASISKWWLSRPEEEKVYYLKLACPDLPKTTIKKRVEGEEDRAPLRPTDALLPELAEEALCAAGGKVLILFFTRRLVSSDLCFHADMKLLKDLRAAGALPDFSDPSLPIAQMDTPFIDPFDAEDNIRSLGPNTSAAARAEVLAHIASGRLIEPEIFLSLKIRRSAICKFLTKLMREFEKNVEETPSPSFDQLVLAEMLETQMMRNEEEKERQAVIEANSGLEEPS